MTWYIEVSNGPRKRYTHNINRFETRKEALAYGEGILNWLRSRGHANPKCRIHKSNDPITGIWRGGFIPLHLNF